MSWILHLLAVPQFSQLSNGDNSYFFHRIVRERKEFTHGKGLHLSLAQRSEPELLLTGEDGDPERQEIQPGHCAVY